MTTNNDTRLAKFVGSVLLSVFIGGMIKAGSTKPPAVVVEEGIKILDVRTDAQGIRIEFETTDDRIEVGTDDFVIIAQDRQIPARKGWGNPYELGRTKNLIFEKAGFFPNRDIRIKIQVDKGAISE